MAVNLFSYRITSNINVFASLFFAVSLLRKGQSICVFELRILRLNSRTLSEKSLARTMHCADLYWRHDFAEDERQCDDTGDKQGSKNAKFFAKWRLNVKRFGKAHFRRNDSDMSRAKPARLAPTVKVKKMTPAYWTSDCRVCVCVLMFGFFCFPRSVRIQSFRA